MNIKSVNPNILAPPVRAIEKVKGGVKSDETHDREGNGQQTFDQNKNSNSQEPMSEGLFLQYVEQLKNLGPIKEHGWLIEIQVTGNKRFVLVKDKEGVTIRRIPEHDLRTLTIDKDSTSGQLLSKTA